MSQNQLLAAQKNEKTEQIIYSRFAQIAKNSRNRDILLKLARMELVHHDRLRDKTRQEIKPYRLKIFFYYILSRIFGLTFGLKLMEKRESRSQKTRRLNRIKTNQIPLDENEVWISLGVMLFLVIVIIVFFNLYTTVARGGSFFRKFGQMAGLSLGIAALTFGIGYIIRKFFGIQL